MELRNKVIKFQNKTWEFGLHKHLMTGRTHLYILNKTSGRVDDNAYVTQSMKVVSDFQLPEYIARKILQRIGYQTQ